MRQIKLFAMAVILAVVAIYPSIAVECGDTGRPGQTVSGRVVFRGEVPSATIADNAGRKRPLLEVNRQSKGLRYCLVYVTPLATEERSPSEAITTAPSKDDSELKEAAVVDQRDHVFVPHLLAVESGTVVAFSNSDPANHNVRASALDQRNTFNVFTPANGTHRHRFYSDKNRPVRLGCDIHPWMTAWIYPLDTPYYAVTDKQGRYKIEGIPPGQYKLSVRQPDAGLREDRMISIESGKQEVLDFEFSAD